MGLIQSNTNTFQVYLTDLGKEKYLNGGLKNAIVYFSLSDADTNYDTFAPNPNDVLTYDSANLANYKYGDFVVTGGTYYKFKVGTLPRDAPSTGSTWWDKKILFNPNIITAQPIPTQNHHGTKLTSLGNENSTNDDFIDDVFIQTALRGNTIGGTIYNNVITGIKVNTQKSYILYEPDVAQSVTPITTYIEV